MPQGEWGYLKYRPEPVLREQSGGDCGKLESVYRAATASCGQVEMPPSVVRSDISREPVDLHFYKKYLDL